MGSYISIHNNTRDPYLVKVGPDTAAIGIATVVVTVFAAVATVVATAGAAAPFSAALVANGVIDVFFVSTEALAAFTAAAASISGISIASTVTGWATSTVLFITQKLQSEGGFVEILPGERKTFGKYSLSLWRQAQCVRVRPNPANSEEVVMDTLYMRPIFSGATAESTNEHSLQYWIGKWGHEDVHTIRLSEQTRRAIG
ncbi:uncharacterized protein LOC9650910 [Selaginella moellendorffii]|uniref:uncharacterized protein LOC9650910 n=1 Tax=Selaginella moellendorffii TaxID=88036 RepID=UPI000D1C858A|nr:uncharacterized protein LOC9650910 [Selaginella moellendorffii]|eukprot:XP_024521610.1 uncharacterized protein LOC9650910 [Selaginella moellendorffii]